MTSRPANLLPLIVALMAFGATRAAAGEKILFSGRDGRQTQYHRSLNARPLFESGAFARDKDSGPSASDAIFTAPTTLSGGLRTKKDEKERDWAFQSTEELGSERIEKEILGEDDEVAKGEIKRTEMERFLDREREKRAGNQGTSRRGSTTERNSRGGADPEADIARLRMQLQQNSPALLSASPGTENPGQPATADASTPQPSSQPEAQGAFSPQSSLAFQREHVDRLKSSLGVAAAPGVDPFGGTPGGVPNGIAKDGFGQQSQQPDTGAAQLQAGNLGAYPGSQGLGLMDLTSPANQQRVLLPQAPRQDANSSPAPRESLRPGRNRGPKRDIF